ncbi:CAAX prenyl protease 2 [Epargyreus clarus]|uniref:CAAX prenyl protease 2 n=1 Tax=Epargyreus clarus TaxID=520877 RepID=UPI003C2ED839
MGLKEFRDDNACILSIIGCIFLTFCYVGSLYVWKSSLGRDHPTTIKRRFFSVFCMMLLAPFFAQLFLTEDTLARADVLEHMGLRMAGSLKAATFPLILTAILFLGPLTMQYFAGVLSIYLEPAYWWTIFHDLVWVRNHLMAPLSEEWVFRSCMVPMLMQCFDLMTAVFVGPLLFGIAHFHHLFEQVKAGVQFKSALFISLFQFLYTSLFGAYSAYLFITTGHFLAPLVAHIFCNHMGFPNFGEIFQFPPMERAIILWNLILGFALWCSLLPLATDPEFYDNKLYALET